MRNGRSLKQCVVLPGRGMDMANIRWDRGKMHLREDDPVGLLRRAAPAVLLFVLAACPSVAVAQLADPLAVVTAFNTALNAHDGAAALALLADDAVVTTPSGTVYMGKQQIGAYVQGLFAQNYQAQVDSQRIHAIGSLVTSQGKVWLDEWRTLGIAPLDSIAEATVQGGKISSLRAVLTPESAARLQAAQSRAPAPAQLPQTGEPLASIPLALVTGVTLLGLGLGLKRQASERSVGHPPS
jgi:limonene-1,2-epoxide hydrolase